MTTPGGATIVASVAAYGFVDGSVACPECGERQELTAFIFWGLCATGGYNNGIVYRVGDRIHWRSDHDRGPEANVFFGGPASAINAGDPNQRAVYLLNLMMPPGDTECPKCQSKFVEIVEIHDGVVTAFTGCNPSDRCVAKAIALGKDTDSVQFRHVKWNHGITDGQLDEVAQFLQQYELSEPTLPLNREMTSEERDAFLQHSRMYRRNLTDALLTGVENFPRDLLCHALARKIKQDPFILERQLHELQRTYPLPWSRRT